MFEEPERTRFYKKINYQTIYSNTDVSEYNVQAYITKLEEMVKYDFPFERIKHLLGEEQMQPEKKDLPDINEEDEESKVEEVTDEQAQLIEDQN